MASASVMAPSTFHPHMIPMARRAVMFAAQPQLTSATPSPKPTRCIMRRVGKKVERKLGEPIGAALKEVAQRLEFTPRITQGQGSVLGGGIGETSK